MRTTHKGDTPISVVDRVSTVLEAFNGSGPMTLAQVTARTSLPRSSVHRLLEQLTAAGWLARSPEQTYELGVKAYELGQAALNQNRLLRGARPVMHAFAHRTGYTVQLGVVDRGDCVYLAKVNGRLSGPTPTAVGQRVPAHLTALGKATLAHAEPGSTNAALHVADDGSLVRRTAMSLTDPQLFADELAMIRDRGGAFDRGEAFAGIGCVGVSIGPPDHIYGNLAALSICAPLGTLDHRKLLGPVRIAAREIWDRCVQADLAAN
ncbi:IclR family transcriptional regulator [Gordonia paraffinivorans]|uniref:Pectin degradation repressor protein kdgR n=1 Tax=Gordonia paraffinivorans TaxID=175628 RepID=A0ABD7V5X5_9ACTN|nr:IclR family transcriptional regulator [Gordonia paraffinivorans]MCD2145671.1 IclR family transcriptional regulator [Gordonia paraffinivorans]VFA89660.1 Pectin degradation repressor protein kdgR [Gordonia paraffinivorans]